MTIKEENNNITAPACAKCGSSSHWHFYDGTFKVGEKKDKWFCENCSPYTQKVKNCETQEKDTSGKNQHEPGMKLDYGKNRLGLVLCGFARALQEVGKVGTYGAKKYSDNGWLKVANGVERYTDAMFRHLMREASGEEIDNESSLLHAAHSAWNSLARLELLLRNIRE